MQVYVLGGILMGAFLVACQEGPGITATDAPATDAERASGPAVPGFGRGPVVLAFKGTGDVSPGNSVPDPNGVLGDAADNALCLSVDLVDVRRDRVVGEARECFVVVGGTEDGSGLLAYATSTFDFGRGHSFTTQAPATAQPILDDPPPPGVTHITGAVPPPGQNTVIEGTGRYAGFRASVRIAGAVDLSRLESEGKITLDCLFVVTPL